MQKTSKTDLIDAIKKLGIKPNDVILLHSAMYRFGRIEFTPRELLTALKSYFSDGDIIIPTFTYSFRRNEIYDIKKSLPDKRLGILNREAFHFDHYRNECPQFSFISLNKVSSSLLELQSQNCFGQASTFDKLCDENVKILSLGVDFSSGITMFLNFEKLARVPYRFDLHLNGKMIDQEGTIKTRQSTHFAFNEQEFVGYQTNRQSVGEKLIKNGICKTYKVSKVPLYCLESNNFRDSVVNELIKNPYVMLEKK